MVVSPYRVASVNIADRHRCPTSGIAEVQGNEGRARSRQVAAHEDLALLRELRAAHYVQRKPAAGAEGADVTTVRISERTPKFGRHLSEIQVNRKPSHWFGLGWNRHNYPPQPLAPTAIAARRRAQNSQRNHGAASRLPSRSQVSAARLISVALPHCLRILR